MTTKTKILYLILACVSGSVLFLASAEAWFLIITDILAGALRRVPETGWGFLLALFLFTPIVAAAFFVFSVSSKKYNAAANKPAWILWVISLVLAIGIAGSWTLLDGPGPAKLPPETANDVNTTKELTKAQTQIRTRYYTDKGTLPNETALSSPLGPGITYKVINQNTYELCGNFDTDSVSPLLQKGSSRSDGVPQKVVEGSVLKEIDAIGVFRFHSADQQCYKLNLDLPVN